MKCRYGTGQEYPTAGVPKEAICSAPPFRLLMATRLATKADFSISEQSLSPYGKVGRKSRNFTAARQLRSRENAQTAWSFVFMLRQVLEDFMKE